MSRPRIHIVALGSAGNRRPLFAAALACLTAGYDVVCVTTPPSEQWSRSYPMQTRLLSSAAAAYLSAEAVYPDVPESAAAVSRWGRLQIWLRTLVAHAEISAELERYFADADLVICPVGYARLAAHTGTTPIQWVTRAAVPAAAVFRHTPILVAASRFVHPGGTDGNGFHRVVGEWLLPDVPDVPTALQRFVRVNQPFMLVTHGGFLHPYAHNVVQRAVACAHELGLRALVVLPEDNDVLTSDERTMVWHQPVSAAAVIAAAAVVVHPGGAGTTQRVVRAGVPGVPVALYPSDVLWAEQCFRVQLTPTVLHAQTVTHNALSDAIAHAVTDVAYRYQARALATEMAREDGLAQLIQTIRPYIGTP